MPETAVSVSGLSKFYKYYARELDRVKEIFSGRPRFQQIHALRDLSLEVNKGEVLGVIGRNGAGKSTLLKILAGTLQASAGELRVNGRVAALLELGAGLHPEMSGHENIYLNCAIQGLSRAETEALYPGIVAFADLGEFMERPVKTYSSGMFIRLAFSIAVSVDPDLLIIDEALSVGDGVFSRKSLDRVMDFKEAGKTILFCSHSLYQVEVLCDRVLWLHEGEMKRLGAPSAIITEYDEAMRMASPRRESLEAPRQSQEAGLAEEAADQEASREETHQSQGAVADGTETEREGAETAAASQAPRQETGAQGVHDAAELPAGSQAPQNELETQGDHEVAAKTTKPRTALPRVLEVQVRADGRRAEVHHLTSGEQDVEITVLFDPGQNLPLPSVAVGFTGGDGRIVASAGTVNDGVAPRRDEQGRGMATLLFPRLALLRGRYNVDVALMCERGLHVYEGVLQAAIINIEQKGLERGVVNLPHQWKDVAV